MIAPPSPPSHDELEALIREARERQLRRRLLGAATIATAAAVGLGIYALAGGFTQSPTSGGAHGPGAVPLCRSSQLATSIVFHGGIGLGGYWGGATIRNTSGSSCALPSRQLPIVQILWHGTPVSLREIHPGKGRYLVPVLRAGRAARIEMVWQNSCSTPHVAISHGGIASGRFEVVFRIRLGSGPMLTAPSEYAPSCLAPDKPTALQIVRPS